MTLLTVVITYLILRWFGPAKPLQRDDWFFRWCDAVAARLQLPLARFLLSLLAPVIALLIVLILLGSVWYWLQLLIAVPVLLYSVGRGKFTGLVSRYLRARRLQSWSEALASWKALRRPVDEDNDEALAQDDWAELDRRMLMLVSYRGFERTFVVLFWFVLLGPAGALLYRLSNLYRNHISPGTEAAGTDDEGGFSLAITYADSAEYARVWLWLLEWPAARVLGLSFALTGNFVSCLQSWRHFFWSTEHSTAEVLLHSVRGALHMDEELSPSAIVLEREVEAALSLFSRTLIFWICVLALGSVLL